MANDQHVTLLKQGVTVWNAWRTENPRIQPDLGEANLQGADLSRANLSRTNLTDARLGYADLVEADLSSANLSGAKCRPDTDLHGAILNKANLSMAFFYGANFRDAQLREANLSRADLTATDLSGADLRDAQLKEAYLKGAYLIGANLSGADLQSAVIVDSNLTRADLTGCHVYGVSAWGLELQGSKQQNLIITRRHEPAVAVDNVEVAQFIHLLLHNDKIRDVIDTVGKKGVLLLGRFTEGRMVVLERLRERLRDLGFVPMVFNFDKPETKDFSETVRLLANLSKFVIVDITNPRSAPLELQAAVPDYMVPFVPILQQGEQPFAMFADLQNKYDWVLQPVLGYPSVDRLLEVLEEKIVRPAEAKFIELLARRTTQLRVENV